MERLLGELKIDPGPTLSDLTLAALGGPHTFGGQAAVELVRQRPDLGRVCYLDTSPELFADDGVWRASAACAPVYTAATGPHLSTLRRVADQSRGMTVVAETVHAYHCALLTLPGAQRSGIRTVLGHTGSINQSRGWLRENLPDADIEIVTTNSAGAADQVRRSSGDIASVGSVQLASEVGLEVNATDIDGGSQGMYWALSGRAGFADEPDRVVLAGRVPPEFSFSPVIARLQETGFTLRFLWQEAVGDQLFHLDAVAHFVGHGSLTSVRAVLDADGPLRLAGAYAHVEQS